ncbi:M23 family metallopeptidase [Tepidibacter formicigenes]|uniref:Peptidase family M23 n=1 Tax=Tepidibacter formicigenes DSM 15518 TaxID=1123349 RepID=A0A1M6SQI8_9FIRM|nr:M23 family metallopeptidase [Tepidibacter formicigenes]SHK46900.1 Peptidase family M23 [Tepidibacter formicigenes DSM 15518]
MENNNKNKGKKLLERDGFYLVLFLCVCLVALTAVWVTKNSIDNLATEDGFVNYEHGELIDESDDKVASNGEDEIHLIKDNEKVVPTSTSSQQNLAKAKEKLAKENESKNQLAAKKEAVKINAIMPTEGELIRDYSDTEPSYSVTLDQWELHKGIDIKADKGTPVKAVMNGEVLDVAKNERNGVTVKIKHEGNLVTVYSNLSLDTIVEKGQKLNRGDVISSVGNTSIVESKEGPHLHFEVLKDGKNIDPLSIINSN